MESRLGTDREFHILLGFDGFGLVASPTAEEFLFPTGGLEGLDHLEATDGGAAVFPFPEEPGRLASVRGRWTILVATILIIANADTG